MTTTELFELRLPVLIISKEQIVQKLKEDFPYRFERFIFDDSHAYNNSDIEKYRNSAISGLLNTAIGNYGYKILDSDIRAERFVLERV